MVRWDVVVSGNDNGLVADRGGQGKGKGKAGKMGGSGWIILSREHTCTLKYLLRLHGRYVYLHVEVRHSSGPTVPHRSARLMG